jgi:hypothetical protein
MKRVALLATVACLAATFPALAQGNPNGSPPQAKSHQQQSQTTGSNGQMGNQAQQQNSNQMQASNGQERTIQPSSLSRREIREVQRNLNKSGFDAKRVDGIWGRETEAALRNFQQAKRLPGNGQLDQQTLSALGVNIGNQSRSARGNQNQQQYNASSGQNGQQGQSQTVGQAPAKNNPPQGAGQNTKKK